VRTGVVVSQLPKLIARVQLPDGASLSRVDVSDEIDTRESNPAGRGSVPDLELPAPARQLSVTNGPKIYNVGDPTTE